MVNKLTSSELENELARLNGDATAPWIIRNGKLHKVFRFSNFVKAFAFMTKVAIYAEKANHHPEWSNVYDKVEIDLVTHEADGITERDFKLARTIDDSAK